MDMHAIINQIIMLFILIAAGLAARRINLLSAEGVKALSRLVLYFSMPATILNSVMDGEVALSGGDMLFFALMSICVIGLHLVISIPAVMALGGDKKKRGLYRYMSVFGNSANMGFPVTVAILGAVSAFYVAVYNIPYGLLCYSVGVVMVSGKSDKLNLKLFLNPSLISGIIAVVIVASGFKAPAIIAGTVKLASGITTPCAMLIIGASLYGIPLKDTFSNWRLYPIIPLKLIVMPVATWLIFKQFVTDKMMLDVLVIMSAMASGAMSTIFAIEYGGDERTASSGVFLTTLLSGVTIPLVVRFLLMSI